MCMEASLLVILLKYLLTASRILPSIHSPSILEEFEVNHSVFEGKSKSWSCLLLHDFSSTEDSLCQTIWLNLMVVQVGFFDIKFYSCLMTVLTDLKLVASFNFMISTMATMQLTFLQGKAGVGERFMITILLFLSICIKRFHDVTLLCRFVTEIILMFSAVIYLLSSRLN